MSFPWSEQVQNTLMASIWMPWVFYITFEFLLITRITAWSNSMKPNHAAWGYLRWTAHGGEVWQNVFHWRSKWQTSSVFLPWEPHEQYEKAKWWDTERGTPQVSRCPICYWRSLEKKLQKEWRDEAKEKNNTQLWMWLVIEIRSEAVKAILHKNLECWVHESRQIGSGQTRDGKSEHRHSRNQRTKIDWNGWI